jgi:hypothetical protein
MKLKPLKYRLGALLSMVATSLLLGCPTQTDEPDIIESDYQMNFDAGAWSPPEPDVTAPTITLLSPTSTCLSDSVTFHFRAEDTESMIGFVSLTFAGQILTLTDLGNSEYEVTTDVSTLFEGTHTLLIKAFDLPNNEGRLEQVFGVSQGGGVLHEEVLLCDGPIEDPNPPGPVGADAGPDLIAPELSFIEPLAGELIGSTPRIQVRAIDTSTPMEFELSIGTQTFEATSQNGFHIFEPALTGLNEGAITLTLKGTDAVDNMSEIAMDVSLDATPPVVRIVEPNAGEDRLALTDVKACVKDANGIALVMLHEQGTSTALATNNSPLVRTDGSVGPCNSDEDEFGLFYDLRDTSPLPRDTTFIVSANDSAGNTGSSEINLRILPIN